MTRSLFSKISVAVLLLAAIAVASLYALNWAAEKLFVAGMCGNKVQAEATSPDGKLRAVVFERDCGATTGFSQQVSILGAGEELPNEAGNTFRADMYYGHDPGNPEASNPGIEVRWAGNDGLVIVTHNRRAKIFHVAPVFKGVSIRHEDTPNAASSNGMRRTRNRQSSYPSYSVRAADAGR